MKEAEEKATLLFALDSGTGIVRHADAGYETSRRIAMEKGIKTPMLK